MHALPLAIEMPYLMSIFFAALIYPPSLDPLACWKGMMISPFSVIAVQICRVPASSAPAERNFPLVAYFVLANVQE